jgi:hypothetical protein
MGLEQNISVQNGCREPHQGLRENSFLRELLNPDFFRSIQGVTQPRIKLRKFAPGAFDAASFGRIDCYSAAAANADLVFAADNMKSDMRGTISDLKREPLKTP